jgi:nicotinate-nucleotide adenylyltransferase
MNIGLFGGTFDPIHRGHLALARAALERCNLNRIHFVPVGTHPLKGSQPSASYFDRYAMVALATQGEKAFVPSLLEAPDADVSKNSSKDAPKSLRKGASERAPNSNPNFSIDTVRKLKQSLKKIDHLFFLIGIDAFKDIAKWREPEALLRECNFIVASRPGFSLADVANSLPESLRPSAAVTKPFHRQPAKGDLVLSGATIHLLDDVNIPVSATVVRQAVSAKKPLGRLLDPKVEEYIKKRGLYGGKQEQ